MLDKITWFSTKHQLRLSMAELALDVFWRFAITAMVIWLVAEVF